MTRLIISLVVGYKCFHNAWKELKNNPNRTIKDIEFKWNE